MYKRDLLIEALRKELPGEIQFHIPKGGIICGASCPSQSMTQSCWKQRSGTASYSCLAACTVRMPDSSGLRLRVQNRNALDKASPDLPVRCTA